MSQPLDHLFLLGSARRDGNAERLARLAAEGLPAAASQAWIYLPEHQLAPFTDIRHEAAPVYAAPQGHEAFLLEQTLAARHLVFAMPLYWYSMPADVKRYLDYWSAWLRVPGADFKRRMQGKAMSVITVLSDDDSAFADPLLNTMRLCADYMGMRFVGAAVAMGNRPGDVMGDVAGAQRAAALLAAA